jgi:hypothetical protein
MVPIGWPSLRSGRAAELRGRGCGCDAAAMSGGAHARRRSVSRRELARDIARISHGGQTSRLFSYQGIEPLNELETTVDGSLWFAGEHSFGRFSHITP